MVDIMAKPLYPRERTPAPIKQWTGWTPEPVWTFQRTEKSLAPPRIRTPDRPASSLRYPGSHALSHEYVTASPH
jgi:hypothetical protein